MILKNFNYKDILEKILVTPEDNRLKSAKTFWKKETAFFKKIYQIFPNEKFWNTLSLQDTPATNGKIPSLVMFFDKKNDFWIKILEKKWKHFNWSPQKIKNYPFKRDVTEKANYKIKKRGLRGFFD